MQEKSSYKNYKKEIRDLKLRFITGRSQRQVPIFQWHATTGRSAAPGKPEHTMTHTMCNGALN